MRSRALNLLALLAAIAPCAALLTPAPAGADSLPMPGQPQAMLPSVVLAAPNAAISAQVARTEGERELGLTFYRSLPPHHGMIFVFQRATPMTMWMHNMLIPIDMVFISQDGKVNAVGANVPADSEKSPGATTTRAGSGPFVLELPAGEAARDGITVGSHIKMPPLTAADDG